MIIQNVCTCVYVFAGAGTVSVDGGDGGGLVKLSHFLPCPFPLQPLHHWGTYKLGLLGLELYSFGWNPVTKKSFV